MTKDNDKPIHTESMQYRFDALNTAMQNHAKLKHANEFIGANSSRFDNAAFNTISGLLWQAITDSQKRIIQCAEFYCATALKENAEIEQPA